MDPLDISITKTYFRLEEAQRQRLWMERIWHPEHFDWKKHGEPPPMTETKRTREESLKDLGFGPDWYDRMAQAEAIARAELEELAQTHVLWPHLRRIKGFGPYLSGALIAASGDIERCSTVASFWKGMGLDVLPLGLFTTKGKEVLPPGAVPRRIRGSIDVVRKVPCLPHVSRVGEQVRQQFLRSGGKLYVHYQQFREQEETNHPQKAKMFRFKSALRKTQKILYACLWEEWRLARHLPAPEPYAFAILKHHDNSRIRMADLYDR